MRLIYYSMFSVAVYLVVLLPLSLQDHDVFTPMPEELATKIHCEVNESRLYKYDGVIDLWSDIEGRILLQADVILHCLGNDEDGTYGRHALKYMAEISNLQIDEEHKKFEKVLQRRKRGIGEWFSNAWQSVKNFFINLFGGSTSEETHTEAPTWTTDDDWRRTTDDDWRRTTDDDWRRTQWTPDNRVSDWPIEDTTPATPTTTASTVIEDEDYFDSVKYKSSYSAPFVFIQLKNGSVPDVRFSANETDSRVRNFKRHLVDAFATQLNLNADQSVIETSVMGEHRSKYNITMGPMSSAFSAPDESPEQPAEEDDETIVVEKKITEDDILTLAPTSENAAINDKDKIEMNTMQTQIFQKGNLVSSSGTSHMILFPKFAKRHRKRRSLENNKAEEENLLTYFQSHTQYQLQLQKRRKRSLDDNSVQLKTDDLDFSASSRAAESEDFAAKERIRQLQSSIGNAADFLHDQLKNNSEANPEKMQTVFELVDQEVRYSMDEEPESIANEIRKAITKEIMEDICATKFSQCIDLMQLLARAGGQNAEEVLLFFITQDRLSLRQRQEVSDLLSDLSKPSTNIVKNLNNLLREKRIDSSLLGSISLSTSNMVSKTNSDQKKDLGNILSMILESSWQPTQTITNPLTLDILEAFGNIGPDEHVDQILQISAASKDRVEIQIACAHALRHVASLKRVQEWIHKMIINGPCDVVHAVVGSLLDEISVQETARDEKNWPRNGLLESDAFLRNQLANSAPEIACATLDIARYFKKKRLADGDNFFDTDSEVFQPGSHSRQKRAIWDALNCGEWTQDNKYDPIQNKDEFDADLETYNKRKSCLTTKTLGLTGANSEIYAGMFAGVKEPSQPPKYKLFTKFVSGVNFLGHEREIGSFYFYHHSGYTKAYVRIMGRTRQEFRNEGCTPNELKYHPVTHIPLYLVQISVLQFSLGIHLSSQLALDTLCPTENSYDMTPRSLVRVGGEAMATVLFARGAINLGGNFNYNLRFTFSPAPDMCLTGEHGYDPMSISMEAYYQLWNIRRLRWGKPRVWQPSSLKWEVGNSRRQPWFNDTCILKDRTPVTSVKKATDPPDQRENENDILVVSS